VRLLGRRGSRAAALAAVGAVAALSVGVGQAVAAEPRVRVEVKAPRVLGPEAEPAPLDVVVHNPEAARTGVAVDLELRSLPRADQTSGENFTLQYRDVRGAWRPVPVRKDWDDPVGLATVPAVDLAARAATTVPLRFGFHQSGGAWAAWPEVRSFPVDAAVRAPGSADPIGTGRADVGIARPTARLVGVPAVIKAGGAPTAFTIEYTNSTESRYRTKRPMVSLGSLEGITAGQVRLEQYDSRRRLWTRVSLVEMPIDSVQSEFGSIQPVSLAPRSTVRQQFRLALAGTVGTGPTRLDVALRSLDENAGLDLDWHAVGLTVTK
jgi:hypothetical protein